MHLYSIRFLNKNVQIRASEKPEQFIQLVSSFHDLFLCESCLSGYQIWHQDDTVWIPIYGVPEEQVIPVIFEDLIADTPSATDNSRELGKIIIENYKKWFTEQEAIKHYNARRTGDPERLEVLHRKMKCVQCSIIEMMSESGDDIDVKLMFTYMINGTIAEATKKLNISRATYYRWQDHVYEMMGKWLLNNLASAQLDELRIHTIESGEYVGDSSASIPKRSD